jgi:hypothetical protein
MDIGRSTQCRGGVKPNAVISWASTAEHRIANKERKPSYYTLVTVYNYEAFPPRQTENVRLYLYFASLHRKVSMTLMLRQPCVCT